jgi:hypothetical protein
VGLQTGDGLNDLATSWSGHLGGPGVTKATIFCHFRLERHNEAAPPPS